PFLKQFLHADGSKHEKMSGEVIENCNFEIITSLTAKTRNLIEKKIRPIIAGKIENQDLCDKIVEISLNRTLIIYKVKSLDNNPFESRGKFYFNNTITEINNF